MSFPPWSEALRPEPRGFSEGRELRLFTLRSDSGLTARILNRGACLTELWVPDRRGLFRDIVLGYPDEAGYEKNPFYMGAVVGRFANRIAAAPFRIGRRSCRLPLNEGGRNHLHGGVRGFHTRLWEAEVPDDPAERRSSLKLRYSSPDGEEGYPGRLETEVLYRWEGDSLHLRFRAETKAPEGTILNLTGHSYFNLKGHNGFYADPDRREEPPANERRHQLDTEGHELKVTASRYLAVDKFLIPDGRTVSVAGKATDLRRGRDVRALSFCPEGRTDCCYVLDPPAKSSGDKKETPRIETETENEKEEAPWNDALTEAAVLSERSSGRVLSVETDYPGMQFYDGAGLDVPEGKDGFRYGSLSGLCLEPQFFPDTPHHPRFPSARLLPGTLWEKTILYRFSCLP